MTIKIVIKLEIRKSRGFLEKLKTIREIREKSRNFAIFLKN